MRSLVVLSRNRWIDHRHCSFQVDILHILVETTQDITRKNLNSLFHFHFHYRANDYLFICMEHIFIKNIYLSQKLTKNRNNYRLVEFSTSTFFSSSRPISSICSASGSGIFRLSREGITGTKRPRLPRTLSRTRYSPSFVHGK